MKKSKLLLLVVMMLMICMLTTLFTACFGGDETEASSSVAESTDEDENEDEEEEEDKAAAGRDEFISELGGVSDTYVGGVSEESYDTANEAAVAYVGCEIAGDKYVEDVEAVSKGELNDKEINALKLPEELQEGIESVEKFEVYYSLGEAGAYSLSSKASAKTKVIVYVIRYGKEYKYYTPCPVTGETITKSYYDSVFNKEKYENCTFTKVSYVEVKAGFQKLTATVTQNIKRTDGKIFFEQIVEGDSMLTSQLGATQNYLAAYIEIDEDGNEDMYVKQSQNGSWTEGYLYGYSAETLVPFYDQYLDYTYFSKADFGFALTGDNALRFYSETISGQGQSQYLEDAELDLYAEYYVADGVLSGMRMEYSATIKVNGSKQTTTGENTMTCTNYGTTVIERPF